MNKLKKKSSLGKAVGVGVGGGGKFHQCWELIIRLEAGFCRSWLAPGKMDRIVSLPKKKKKESERKNFFLFYSNDKICKTPKAQIVIFH